MIVSVGMFTSFLFEPSFGIVDLDHGEVLALGSWDNAVTVTTPEDIGKLTTEILLTEPELQTQSCMSLATPPPMDGWRTPCRKCSERTLSGRSGR